MLVLVSGLGLVACRPAVLPLTGHLTVTLRSAEGGAARSIEEAGTVPAGHGDLFTVDARLSGPAFIYLVWLSADGRVVPLYPWNDDTLEVHDVALVPPQRRPTHFVMCPAQSSSWTLGEREGVETLLLLARRQPLTDASSLARLLKSYEPPLAQASQEPQWWTWSAGTAGGQVLVAAGRHDAASRVAESGPLVELLQELGKQFDLVHAVQFAHRGPAAEQSPSTP